jgi:hypothetical protein
MTNTVSNVINVFDTTTYPRATNPGRCFCCGREARTVTGPSTYRGRFKAMTGHKWPGPAYFSVAKDFDCLGLDSTHVPAQALFCLPCAVDYMNEFNRRLDLAQLAAGRM